MIGPFHVDDFPSFTEDARREIAARTRCPQVGDAIHIGDTVALGIEPGDPYARVVGFVYRNADGTPAKGIRSILIRCYRKGDGWFPTGELRTTSTFGICPWIAAPQLQKAVA